MRVHHELIRGAIARPWMIGAVAAMVTAFVFAGCDLSGLGVGSTACTPQTCDYVVNSLVAVGSGSTDVLLADSHSNVYQYSGTTWTKAGAETATQRGDGLFASPAFATDKTLFLGNTTSVDGGKTWSPLCTIVKGISPNFASDHTVFGVDAQAGSTGTTSTSTGTPATGPTGCPSGTGAFYTSTNGGQSWTAATGPQGAGDPDIFAVSPAFKTDKTIFATFTINLVSALYKSTDAGQSWNKVLDDHQSVVAISPNYAQDNTVIAVSTSKVQRSTDGGSNWSALTTPVAAAQVSEIAISPNVASDKTLALVSAAVDTGSTAPHGTFISTDNGGTWTSTGTVTQSGLNHPAFVFSPNFSTNKTVYTASQGQAKGPASSTDLGKTWTDFNAGLDLQAAPGG